MSRPPQSTPSGKHFLTKAAPKELFESELLGDALSLRTSDESSINAERFDLAVAAVKRLNSLMTKASPDVQQDALRTIKTSLSESAANAIARAILDGTSTLAEKSTAQKAHDLLQGLASMCQILTGLNQGEQAASIAAPFVESGIVNGSTAQLRVAGAKPMIVILSYMQNFVNANSLPEDLIGEVLQGIDISGESAYRSRLILGLISNQAYTQRLGYPGSQEAAAALLRTWYRPDQLSKSDLSALSIHFLPILLEKYPTLAVHSLQDLSQSASTAAIGDKSAYLAAWTAIARVAVVVSCLKLAELDMRLLKWAIHHAEDAIRLDAWFILTRCSSPTDQLEDLLLDEQGLIAEWLSSNMSVPSLEFRSDYLAAFGKFVDRLYTSANAAVRQNQKPIAQGKQGDAIAEEEFEQQKVSRREYMGRIVQLVQIMLNRFIDPSILLPMSTYHARIITALAMLSYLEQNLGSRQAGKKAGRNQVTWPTIHTEERVDSLIACLTSNFTDVRTQAAELLEFAPNPLPGYTDGSRRDSLLEMALERLNGARNTDAEAGGLLIQVLYHSLEVAPSIGLSLTAQETPAQPDLFLSLLENLEKRVMRISGSATLVEEPLHGILLALIRIVSCWKSSANTTDSPAVMQRILSSIERIWDICRPIIATQQGDDTQHEIAGAHEWLEEAADEMETGEGGRADDAHLTILSNCWRAIKEASNLMSIIFTKLPADAVPAEIVMTAGSFYMRWVRHIRHRGTFSSMATAFEKFLEAPALPQELRIQWLEEQLAFIATGQASTTRRSGAIPFAVLALVHSNNDLVGEAFSRLSQIVRDAENDPARIHAMHSIRVMLLDARHSHLFKRYFEETLILALDAYQTENWSVRNAALLLSANITSRAIGKVLNDLQYRSSRRTSLQEWQMLYPKTMPYFQAVLARSRAIDTMDPATYIVLLIMRSLDTTQTAVLGSISKSLTEPLRPLLAKREIKARQIAAQAMANFLDIQSFTDFAHRLLVALRNRQYTSFNEVHGHILVMQVFLQSKPPNQDSLADLIELARQFTQAVTSQAWPFLIRDDMLHIAAVLGGHAVEKQVPAALSKCSNVDCSDSLRRLVDGHGITSAELMGVLPMLAADPFIISHHNLSERLYNTYTNTSNVPLREALLPVLGQATIPSPTLCGPVLNFIHKAAQVDQSVESRQAAVSALFPFVQELSQSSNQQLFGIADMLLNDDDTVIRKQAAEVVAQAFNNGDSICQEQAEQLLSQERIKRLDSVDFATFLLARLTDLAEIDRLGAGLKDTKHDLFAEEPPNLFIEPYPATQQLFDNFTSLNDGARAHALKECQNRISTCQMVLSQISDADRTNTLPLDPRREGLLLLRQRSHIVSRLASS